MAIDWEGILGTEWDLQAAYDDLLFGGSDDSPTDSEDRGDDRPIVPCDGNYPYCSEYSDCRDCPYCHGCSVSDLVDCSGDCAACPYGPNSEFWTEEDGNISVCRSVLFPNGLKDEADGPEDPSGEAAGIPTQAG